MERLDNPFELNENGLYREYDLVSGRPVIVIIPGGNELVSGGRFVHEFNFQIHKWTSEYNQEEDIMKEVREKHGIQFSLSTHTVGPPLQICKSFPFKDLVEAGLVGIYKKPSPDNKGMEYYIPEPKRFGIQPEIAGEVPAQ